MMNILVTGSAGFIGHKVCEELINTGNHVIGLDNMNDYYDVHLKEYRLRSLNRSNAFKFIKLDIEHYDDLEKIFKEYKLNAIINLAARAGVRYSMLNPLMYFNTNTIGLLNILELMKKYKVNKIVQASTSSLYAGQALPFSEELAVNEPLSPYAASKKSSEMIAYTYYHLYDINATIVRYFTVYGPAGRPDMAVFKFIRDIIEEKEIVINGDGTQTRDFTFIDDVAKGTVLALKPRGYEVINIGGGLAAYSLKDLINLIEKYSNKKAIIKYSGFSKADMKHTLAKSTKAKDMLNWEPKVDFSEGIKRSVDWYMTNRSWAKLSTSKDDYLGK
ncbi:MAG: SDR family NAD(P)-dependent oxidoreductase [Candidatus Pacebacteria bacterium]|nr:SDR family NAD(P)-dependent oxidoreductase [Candidatus Paceibacterota bacterium]